MVTSTTIEKKKVLKLSQEYTQASFTWITSLAVTIILVLNSFDFSTKMIKPFVFSVMMAYVVFTGLQVLLTLEDETRPVNGGAYSKYN